jgi:hypothetical protein
MSGVTLSGKNLFGSWMESVEDVHDYHESGQTMGNAAPQVDLLAHEHLGGKTLLYLGDGMYPTLEDHRVIDTFTMYPFNDDWTSSLFFSQDPVAIDSVMYDFLYTEGANPTEGSQNYLHQAAEPAPGVYDPENDGTFLSTSLGVHEHWNTSVDIFARERYTGPAAHGIDFVAITGDTPSPALRIVHPRANRLYVAGREIASCPVTLVVGSIDVTAETGGLHSSPDCVEFYVDGRLRHVDEEEPYAWMWTGVSLWAHTLAVRATCGQTEVSDEITVWKLL